jgi:hypothetical protein
MTDKDLLTPTEVVDFDQKKYEQNLKENTFNRDEQGKDGKGEN